MSGIYLYFRNGLGENLINVFTLKKSYEALKNTLGAYCSLARIWRSFIVGANSK